MIQPETIEAVRYAIDLTNALLKFQHAGWKVYIDPQGLCVSVCVMDAKGDVVFVQVGQTTLEALQGIEKSWHLEVL